jgi:hypothetical protein
LRGALPPSAPARADERRRRVGAREPCKSSGRLHKDPGLTCVLSSEDTGGAEATLRTWGRPKKLVPGTRLLRPRLIFSPGRAGVLSGSRSRATRRQHKRSGGCASAATSNDGRQLRDLQAEPPDLLRQLCRRGVLPLVGISIGQSMRASLSPGAGYLTGARWATVPV